MSRTNKYYNSFNNFTETIKVSPKMKQVYKEFNKYPITVLEG